MSKPMPQHDRDLPPDFLLHLQHELGTPEEATISLLGEWLASYEPAPRPVGHELSRALYEQDIPAV